MRLLYVETLELSEFHPNNCPPYVIASHRWQLEEASFEDVVTKRNMHKEGFEKIRGFADYVRTNVPSVSWLWIDTCCIKKDSTAELSESINLMFKWFREAHMCIVYLEDVEDRGKGSFVDSEWFTRGWALQELLAPRIAVFVTQTWQVIGNKGASFNRYSRSAVGQGLEQDIARRTGIPEGILHDYGEIHSLTVQKRLQWMNGRQTTREEDMVYALYGICNVALGANYGEGYDAARERLLAGIEDRERREKNRQHFRHLPLDDPTSQIRILTILNTGDGDGSIRCSLSHTSLDKAPAYVALSYYWGNANSFVPLLISDTRETDEGEVTFSATVNLEAALRELRKRGVSTVWADMICINQDDVSERNQQVRLMGRIYSEASKVVAWVGPASEGSKGVMQAMQPQDHQFTAAHDRPVDGSLQIPDPRDIRTFLSRPYFARMWIIQELAKAQLAEIWCGEDTVRLEDFSTFLLDGNRAKLNPRQKALLGSIQLFRDHERQSVFGRPRMLVSQALVASRYSISSDPRDNVFAILGLSLDHEHVVRFPDYSKSVEDVFAEASKKIIGVQGHVSIILLARGSQNAGRRSSWIPDWSERTPLPPWIEECLRRERDTLNVTSLTHGEILSLSGRLLDEVEEESSSDYASDACMNAGVPDQQQKTSIQDWLDMFMEDSVQSSAAKGKMHMPVESTAPLPVRTPLSLQETQLLSFENGIRTMAEYGMRLIRLKHRGFRMIHRDAQHNDQIWRLENCSLPVVLRPLSNGRFSLVGEVYADTRDHKWWELTWKDFNEHCSIDSDTTRDLSFRRAGAMILEIE